MEESDIFEERSLGPQHATDDDLVLLYYGEVPDSAGLLRHVDACFQCRERLAGLRADLGKVQIAAAEPPADFEDRIWKRVSPRLGSRWSTGRRWMAIAAGVLILTFTFLAGRYTRPASEPDRVASQPAPTRVLVITVKDHLERSEVALLELANAEQIDGRDEREAAESLLSENRLYRQTAYAAGEGAMAAMLDDLERVLLEVAHAPDRASGSYLKRLQGRLNDEGLVFKIRVMERQLRQRLATRQDGTAGEESGKEERL